MIKVNPSNPNIYRAACRLACATREIARFNDNYRDILQHGGNMKVLQFFNMPTNRLIDEIGDILIRNRGAREVSSAVRSVMGQKFGIILGPISVYKPEKVSVEKILVKELSRVSNLACQMVTVVDGSSKKHMTSAEEESAFRLGLALAQKGIAVVCYQTSDRMKPLLEGIIQNNGLTIGILSNLSIQDHNLFKILIRTPGLESIAALTATLSGRLLIVFGGENDPVADDCLHAAAYKGIPTVLVDTELPKQAQSTLQTSVHFSETEKLEHNILSQLFFFPPQDYFFNSAARPVSYFAGTKFTSDHPGGDFLSEFAQRLTADQYFTISGGGPGPMTVVDRDVSHYAMTIGICSFPTYLSSNPFITVPIVSNYEKESRDMMVLSSIASVNLGGSNTTWREVNSARYYGTPLINCNPTSFPTAHIRKRGSGLLYTADSPSKVFYFLDQIGLK